MLAKSLFQSDLQIFPGLRLEPLAAIVCGLSLCINADAGELRRIQLKDGSVVVGEVAAAANGEFTITSAALGTLRLKDTDIVSISAAAASPPMPSTITSTAKPEEKNGKAIADIQQRINSNPAFAGPINSLKDSPEIKAILGDPELLKAIQSGNLSALEGNPKIEKLIQLPAVQEIVRQVSP